MEQKRLKDPIYGYIFIDEDVVSTIIDVPAFQRLRHIRQTSFAPLYSSALHNRFIHSIGVYHLGKIVLSSIEKSIQNDDELRSIWQPTWGKDFVLACLLHDIGHSPFSHSGEIFYLDEGGSKTEPLFVNLNNLIDNSVFSADMKYYFEQKQTAAPHELMSALVGVRTFGTHITDADFFARCITGYLYRSDDMRCVIKNIFIGLLNSSVIDVDKIDYLIRDMFVTGYDGISIEYERLLNAAGLKRYAEGVKFVFNKGALSVLENVIYAHDYEKKWIQNHSVVLYEFFLIQNAIKEVKKYYNGKSVKLFSEAALSSDGITNPENECAIRLLCDDDIIFTLKNRLQTDLVSEYFDRRRRRHAIWKSEAEYRIVFDAGKSKVWLDSFETQLGLVDKFLSEECAVPLMNDASILKCEQMLTEIEKNRTVCDEDKRKLQLRYGNIMNTLQAFKLVAGKVHIDFDFVLIKANRFSSGFSKEKLEETLIDFPNLSMPKKLGTAIPLLHCDGTVRSNFFYIYYHRSNTSCVGLREFANAIRTQFPDNDL